MFVVLNGRTPLYMGDDRDKAIASFEGQPGSMMTTVNSLDELTVILQSVKFHSQQGACCGGHGHDCHDVAQEGPTPEEVEAFINDAIEAAQAYGAKVLDTVWANLERAGVSRERVSEVLSKVREEAQTCAAEAELSGKQGLAALGDLLIRFGNSLVERSK